MPRPPSDRVEEGFQIWSTAGARKATATARILGVPASTVRYWQRAYGWRERDRAGREADAEVAARAALQAVQRASPDVVRKLLWLCVGEKPLRNRQGQIVSEDGEPVMVPVASNRDAVRAAQLLLGSGLLDCARESSRHDDAGQLATARRPRLPDPLKMPMPSFRYPTPPGMARRRQRHPPH
jgi:hypothetical protein